ncbi:MAG: hypothetical protein LBL73_12175 [Synergistaceae bacterium]|nr:hypothetical protein [Synergistaceae bacterium]
MPGLFDTNGKRASENFYRNAFALAAFAVFLLAIITDSPLAFAAALAFGALSRTAVRKDWKNPAIAERIPWMIRRKQL